MGHTVLANLDFLGGLAGQRTQSVMGIGNFDLGNYAGKDYAELKRQLAHEWNTAFMVYKPRSQGDIAAPIQHWSDECLYVFQLVLTIAVESHDDFCSPGQGKINAGLQRRALPAVDEMMQNDRSCLLGDFACQIRRTIVHHHHIGILNLYPAHNVANTCRFIVGGDDKVDRPVHKKTNCRFSLLGRVFKIRSVSV